MSLYYCKCSGYSRVELVALLEDVRKRISYDPETGIFIRVKASTHRRVGQVCTVRRPDGYLQVAMGRGNILAHRLAFMLGHGRAPVGEIDHINRDKADNRLANLREATKAQNGANKIPSRRSISGIKGASWCNRARKWRATIRVATRQVHLGFFATAEEAHAAYVEAARKYHGEFARAA